MQFYQYHTSKDKETMCNDVAHVSKTDFHSCWVVVNRLRRSLGNGSLSLFERLVDHFSDVPLKLCVLFPPYPRICLFLFVDASLQLWRLKTLNSGTAFKRKLPFVKERPLNASTKFDGDPSNIHLIVFSERIRPHITMNVYEFIK